MKDYLPVLMCDIGGTNSRLRIMLISKRFGEEAIKIDYKRYDTQSFQSLFHLLQTYLEPFVGTDNYPLFAAIAIPGPIEDNKIQIIANIPHWPHTDGYELGLKFKLIQCTLLNDFVAMGYGITGNIKLDKDFFNLTCSKSNDDGVYAVVGAGTGLGHGLGYKVKNSKYHDVLPSEGGHQTFTPFNEVEWKYKLYLLEKFKVDHISIERACSGPALPYLFNFVIDILNIEPSLVSRSDPEFDQKRWQLTPEEIVNSANKEDCKATLEVRKIFIEILATDCSNMCLMTLPRKGLYLVGGITISFENYIKTSKTFWSRFYDKGRLSNFLKDFPVFLVTDVHIGIKGSEEFARRQVESYLLNLSDK